MADKNKSILVATDLSARSDRAVDRAVFLAYQWTARLIVLHAVERGSRLETKPDKVERAIRAVLPNPDADVDIVPVLGPAPAMITQTAEKSGCALIVTGVARYNQIGDFFVGTAVEHIVRHASAPVLVVKQRSRGRYRKILVTTDYSSCSRAALIKAADMFPDAELHLLHVYHVPYETWLNSDEVKREVKEEEEANLDAFLNDPAIPAGVRQRTTASLGYGETTSVVSQVAEEIGADMVAIGTHGRSGFVHAVIGSMAESLLCYVPLDTLMVRETH